MAKRLFFIHFSCQQRNTLATSKRKIIFSQCNVSHSFTLNTYIILLTQPFQIQMDKGEKEEEKEKEK